MYGDVNYIQKCIFFCTDFVDHHFGRAVLMLGIPYVYTQSRILKVHFNI